MAANRWNKSSNPLITLGSYIPQSTFTSSKPITESPVQGAKYTPSQQQRHKNDAIWCRSGTLIVDCQHTPHTATKSQLPTLGRQMPKYFM